MRSEIVLSSRAKTGAFHSGKGPDTKHNNNSRIIRRGMIRRKIAIDLSYQKGQVISITKDNEIYKEE